MLIAVEFFMQWLEAGKGNHSNLFQGLRGAPTFWHRTFICDHWLLKFQRIALFYYSFSQVSFLGQKKFQPIPSPLCIFLAENPCKIRNIGRRFWCKQIQLNLSFMSWIPGNLPSLLQMIYPRVILHLLMETSAVPKDFPFASFQTVICLLSNLARIWTLLLECVCMNRSKKSLSM